jgi:hypothetical protein
MMPGGSIQPLARYGPIHRVGIVDACVSVYLAGGKQRRYTENNEEEQKTSVEFDEVAGAEEGGMAFGGVVQGPDLDDKEGCLQSGSSVYRPYYMRERQKLH